MKTALILLALILVAGMSYAADITLTCSGTRHSSRDPHEPVSYGPVSIVIDFERAVLIWGTDTFLVVGEERNIIKFFKEKGSLDSVRAPLTMGSLDRVTGAFNVTYELGSFSDPLKFTYALTCKPTMPLF